MATKYRAKQVHRFPVDAGAFAFSGACDIEGNHSMLVQPFVDLLGLQIAFFAARLDDKYVLTKGLRETRCLQRPAIQFSQVDDQGGVAVDYVLPGGLTCETEKGV